MLGESVRRRQKPGKPPREPGSRSRWRPLLLALPIALVLPFALGYLLAVYVIFPPTTEMAGSGITVPALIGRSAVDAQRELAAAGLGELQPSELPHPTAPPGQVVAQSPLPGQQLRPGVPVRVALSAGQPRIVVPDVQGYSAERADAMLRRAGFSVQTAEQQSPQAAGRVLGTDPAPGQVLLLPASIMLIISSGPPLPEPDTLPPDTVPAGG